MAEEGRRSDIMAHTASRRDQSSMRDRFDCLSNVYRCFLTGSCPSHSAADVAGVILSGVCGLETGEDRDRDCAPAESRRNSRVELTCISVTLVEKITSTLMSQIVPPVVTLYWVDVLRVLFQDMDLISQLVHHFQAENQILSHLAAKTVSMCLFYHLHKSGTVSPVWEHRCVQAFHSSPPGPEVDACLWSLTEVLKRLLKGAHHEIFGKLLAVFDSSLSALCSKFLPEEREELMQSMVDLTCDRHWGTTFCLLLDLLELLTASSSICGAGVCLRSQRITRTQSSALLKVISRSSEYFVKKRVLLLLKRTVLQKAGEDWALRDVLLTGLRQHLDSDMSSLAQSVLTAVAANWLQSVQVESASFFGGTRHVRADGQNPDFVMLRAVSLLLLKSMELHTQTAGGAAGVQSAIELSGCLQSLWGFLRWHSVQLMKVTHLCCWVSLLFGEQDDDMMEAAKALLSIFLHNRQGSGLDDLGMSEAACASGCNPHCHFLLLLQSISFDHSILLDFLISTETCFLEYFVWYLKYLRADWQCFLEACRRISMPDRHISASCGGDTFALTHKGEPDGVERVQPTGVLSSVEMVGLADGVRLVEYGSSDESDPENMEIPQDEPVRKNNRFTASDLKPEIIESPIPIRQKQYDPTELKSKPNSIRERRPEMSSLMVLQSKQTSCPNTEQVTCETSARVVHCLSKLREVVTRLQTKKLFSYNPSSLLKLLAQVEICSQQSHLSHFNK